MGSDPEGSKWLLSRRPEQGHLHRSLAIQITHWSNLQEGMVALIGVSQSALSGAWSSPLKIEYVPSKYGPTFRYTGTDAVIVVNAEGKVVTGWGKSAAGTGK